MLGNGFAISHLEAEIRSLCFSLPGHLCVGSFCGGGGGLLGTTTVRRQVTITDSRSLRGRFISRLEQVAPWLPLPAQHTPLSKEAFSLRAGFAGRGGVCY